MALLRYSAGGAATLAFAGVLPGAFGRFAARRSTTSTPKRGGTLRFARSVGPTQLDPANSIVAGDVYTLDKIFEPLYITRPDGQAACHLAPGYTVSADGKTYTFALRPGVKFSDGTPLTAADVVFSISGRAPNKKGPLSFLERDHVAQGERAAQVVVTLSAAVGAVRLGHLRVRQRDRAEQTSAARPRPRSSPTRSAPGRSC